QLPTPSAVDYVGLKAADRNCPRLKQLDPKSEASNKKWFRLPYRKWTIAPISLPNQFSKSALLRETSDRYPFAFHLGLKLQPLAFQEIESMPSRRKAESRADGQFPWPFQP